MRSDGYRSFQAARWLLFGGKFVTLADTKAVDLTADLSGFWNGYYRENLAAGRGEIVRYSGPSGYSEFIDENATHRVLTPFPYDSACIPGERFYLDNPALLVRLGSKENISELSDHVVRSELLEAETFARDTWRARWPLPFVVKFAGASGGGDGVLLCRSEVQLDAARRRFAGRRVRIEQWLHPVRNNFNIQLQATPAGDIAFVGGSLQRVQGVRYVGSVISLDWKPPPSVAAVCAQAVGAATALGWHGVCGFDVIEDESGSVYLIDANFRINSSTPFHLLRDYLAPEYRMPLLSTGYFSYPGSPVEFFERFRAAILRRRLIPVGIHYDSARDGVSRVCAAVASEGDPEELASLVTAFSKQRLLPGVWL